MELFLIIMVNTEEFVEADMVKNDSQCFIDRYYLYYCFVTCVAIDDC